jgi:hypothetical protein
LTAWKPLLAVVVSKSKTLGLFAPNDQKLKLEEQQNLLLVLTFLVIIGMDGQIGVSAQLLAVQVFNKDSDNVLALDLNHLADQFLVKVAQLMLNHVIWAIAVNSPGLDGPIVVWINKAENEND